MKLIFSADNHWGIGKDNALLFRVPGDMAFFRTTTTGKVVVMGRKTLQSLPGGKPLPGRTNIVLTGDRDFVAGEAVICHSLPALLRQLGDYHSDDVFIIGGEQVYRQLMPYCDRAHITRFDAVADADSFVPDFDAAPGWVLVNESLPQTEQGISYRFCEYLQRRPTPLRKEQY